MRYFYHYTSTINWNDLQKSKVLLPRTHIYKEHVRHFSAKTKAIIKYPKYTVGFPKIRHKGWVECGLWDEIFRLIKCEVLLKIKIPKNSNGFVREHLYCSPKGMQQKYGEDIYYFGYSGKINVKDPRIVESVHKYWNAAVPLSKYKDNFIVPEVWIPEEVKLEDIDRIPFQK